jgi:hypothetical protein
MSTKPKNAEGRVNVALGSRLPELSRVAKKNGQSKGAFARALIFYGLDKVQSGDLVFSGPSLESKS